MGLSPKSNGKSPIMHPPALVADVRSHFLPRCVRARRLQWVIFPKATALPGEPCDLACLVASVMDV